MSNLPPLPALRVFDAVVRHGNFTKAAAELNMTQSAISYQIGLLERYAGGPLFSRLARGVELNDKGKSVAPVVRRALVDVARSFQQLRATNRAMLTISTMQTIAGAWLAPRLGRFQLAHPEFDIRLSISPENVDLEHSDIDVVIRSGKGNWSGLTSHHLMQQNFTPLCSPHYISREGHPASVEAMKQHVLIDRNDTWWPLWFAKAGVTISMNEMRSSIDVDTQQMAATLAIAGTGIALLSPAFVANDLRDGRLIQLFDVVAESGSDYFLAYHETRRNDVKIKKFKTWILSEAGCQ